MPVGQAGDVHELQRQQLVPLLRAQMGVFLLNILELSGKKLFTGILVLNLQSVKISLGIAKAQEPIDLADRAADVEEGGRQPLATAVAPWAVHLASALVLEQLAEVIFSILCGVGWLADLLVGDDGTCPVDQNVVVGEEVREGNTSSIVEQQLLLRERYVRRLRLFLRA